MVLGVSAEGGTWTPAGWQGYFCCAFRSRYCVTQGWDFSFLPSEVWVSVWRQRKVAFNAHAGIVAAARAFWLFLLSTKLGQRTACLHLASVSASRRLETTYYWGTGLFLGMQLVLSPKLNKILSIYRRVIICHVGSFAVDCHRHLFCCDSRGFFYFKVSHTTWNEPWALRTRR